MLNNVKMMAPPHRLKRFFPFAVLLLCLGVAVVLLLYPAQIMAAVREGILLCLDTIIPSLLGFLIVSSFLTESGLYVLLSKPIAPVTRWLLRLDGDLGAVVLISMIGGYPVGAKMLASLRTRGKVSAEDAERMLIYCINSGPAYLTGAVGIKVFSSARTGLILFLSHILVNILLAVLCGIGHKPGRKCNVQMEHFSFSQCLIRAVDSSIRTMASICGYILAFRVISAVIQVCLPPIPPYTRSIFFTCLEISNITSLQPNFSLVIPVAAALTCFGGLCVLMQIQGILSGSDIRMRRMLCLRPFAACLSGIFAWLLIRYLPGIIETAAGTVAAPYSVSPAASVTLLLLCLLFILFASDKTEKRKNTRPGKNGKST